MGSTAYREYEADEPYRGGGGASADIRQLRFRELDVRLDREDGILWCDMAPSGRPCFSFGMMAEYRELQLAIRDQFVGLRPGDPTPFQYVVSGSRTPGVYNLGGDLGFFQQCIRQGDIEPMRRYAYGCVEGQFENWSAYDCPVITMALVRGDALGGGFEFALSYDFIVAERSARMGLPEVLFNLFPGMGAYSFISRKLDRRAAEALILSGKVYTAEEMHDMGLVDVLADDGCGEMALREHIARTRRNFSTHKALYDARRRVMPVTLNELREVVDIWAETAMRLTDRDLKIMQRLVQAQDKRMAAARAGVRLV
ncbi:crotonase/enoyl-CoA hydratase family protein [Sphingomonas jatrophae]|nr:crotonase/enoyl-CoA hydratase family protein [Sphingomonas jatrophae]